MKYQRSDVKENTMNKDFDDIRSELSAVRSAAEDIDDSDDGKETLLDYINDVEQAIDEVESEYESNEDMNAPENDWEYMASRIKDILPSNASAADEIAIRQMIIDYGKTH